ncbi:hypothetical protein HPB47_008041, partial [Ixodes persulcatus]
RNTDNAQASYMHVEDFYSAALRRKLTSSEDPSFAGAQHKRSMYSATTFSGHGILAMAALLNMHPIMSTQQDVPDAKTGLTPREKGLVRDTWALVRKDVKANAIAIFLT